MTSTFGSFGYTELAGRAPLEMFLVSQSSPDKGLGSGRKAALISIVDDDPPVRKSLERLIKAHGFRTETFASAEDFLETGDQQETACLILDLRLPGMSGLDLQNRLWAESNRVPIVFVSAHDEAESRNQAMKAGAIAFLGKPFNDEVLLQAVHSVVAKWGDGS
jgi:FixJ family two-component response regulator